jgi:hypothetical protein
MVGEDGPDVRARARAEVSRDRVRRRRSLVGKVGGGRDQGGTEEVREPDAGGHAAPPSASTEPDSLPPRSSSSSP